MQKLYMVFRELEIFVLKMQREPRLLGRAVDRLEEVVKLCLLIYV